MKGIDFPIAKTKIDGDTSSFSLEDPIDRKKYFEHKVGAELEFIRDYLRTGTFVGFLMGKKNAGKGTYSKLFLEALGSDSVAHISVGDVVRDAHEGLSDPAKKAELFDYVKTRYRGFIALDKIADIIEGRDTKTLLPTEVILTLVEREIDARGRKAIFIDGFPRELDQISYSLYFRALMGYRDDPDFFVFIDVPETIIDARIKSRVICPECHAPRNTTLLRTKEIGYDSDKKEFYLICDDPTCAGKRNRMVPKEGDELGIEAIRGRIEADDAVIRKLLGLQGVPNVFLRNAIPVKDVAASVDAYELTPSYHYEWDEKSGTVTVREEPWTIEDENGVRSHSLLPAAVVVPFIRQVAAVLGYR